jgi:DNA-binding MarR family transcriptional regulator
MAKTTRSGYDLMSSASHLLHRAQQFAADRFTAAIGSEKITQRQFAVLVGVAAQEGLTQTDLVKSTGIDRSTLAELVARMSQNGYLRRAKAKTDARANTVHLTPKGRTLYSKALPKVRKADDAILGNLPKSKQAAFMSTLKEFAATLDAAADAANAKTKGPGRRTKTSSTARGRTTKKATRRGRRSR